MTIACGPGFGAESSCSIPLGKFESRRSEPRWDAADAEDLPAVLEAARLDPEPEARLMAIQAAGGIGTRDAVLALKDLWPRGDEEVRLAIVGAWAAAARKPRDELSTRAPSTALTRVASLSVSPSG